MSRTLQQRTRKINQNYNHSLGLLVETPNTRSIQKKMLQEFRVRKLRSVSSPLNLKNKDRYNKYYVDPKFQFKSKVDNPKNDKQMLNNEHYIYRNLRNQEFWNWVHPFETKKIPAYNPPANLKDIDSHILEGFKRYIEESPEKMRLPSIVDHVLSKTSK